MKKNYEFFLLSGVNFYSKSGSIMNNLYTVAKVRATFCDVERLVEQGNTVTVRPATEAEELWAFRKLAEIQDRDARRRAQV